MDKRQFGGRWWFFSGFLVFLISCQVPYIAEEDLPVIEGSYNDPVAPVYQPVTRQEVIQTARRYASHLWTPTKGNVLHGYDSQGIRIDTPDVSFTLEGVRPGWWKPDEVNQGVPYQWGGFSSIAEFDQGIADGLAAGDIVTPEKRALFSEGLPTVSSEAVGIGASGFVSRCWRLDRSYSTRELAALCQPLGSYEDLRPGDILNLRDVHVIIFEQFADDRHKAVLGYEAGSPPTWKVLYDHLPVSHLQRMGYQPLRYNHIQGAADDATMLRLRREPATEPSAPAERSPDTETGTLGPEPEEPLFY